MSSQLILMDGGIGHLLKEKGLDKFSENLAFDELFAAGSLANLLRPHIVRRVHEDYSQCCNVITANTFGCTKFHLGKIGKADQAIEVAVAAVKIANDVAKASGKPILVAGESLFLFLITATPSSFSRKKLIFLLKYRLSTATPRKLSSIYSSQHHRGTAKGI
jgi:S-methylmethionine-dependent homocysteine/selenocysteine methylase